MSDKYDKHVRWALENFPLLAIRGEQETRRIVKEAHDAVKGIESVIAVILAVALAFGGQLFMQEFFGVDRPRWQHYTALVVLVGLFTYLSTLVGDAMVRRRIRHLVDGLG